MSKVVVTFEDGGLADNVEEAPGFLLGKAIHGEVPDGARQIQVDCKGVSGHEENGVWMWDKVKLLGWRYVPER